MSDSSLLIVCLCLCALLVSSAAAGGYYWWSYARPIKIKGVPVFAPGPVSKFNDLSNVAKTTWLWPNRLLEADLIWFARHMEDNGTRINVTADKKNVYKAFVPNKDPTKAQNMKLTLFADDRWEASLRDRDDKVTEIGKGVTAATGPKVFTATIKVPAGGAALEITAWNTGEGDAHAGLAAMVENEKNAVVLRTDKDWVYEPLDAKA